ncbi:MAG: helix-turn-helix domain-containing protein [Acidiferrobacter sp.]
MMNEKQFQALLGSVREAGKILCGTAKPARTFCFPEPDVQAIRAQTGLPQAQFVSLLGVSARTVGNWEQHRRKLAGPARVLLRGLEVNPKAVIKALHRPAAWGSSGVGVHQKFVPILFHSMEHLEGQRGIQGSRNALLLNDYICKCRTPKDLFSGS